MTKKAFLAGVGVCASLTLSLPAGAVIFGPDTPEGFVPGLTGASTFGLPDADSSLTCALCDSTVNFTAYHNADGSDWAPDVGLSPTFVSGNDPTAKWVFMYQIQNTDPLTDGEAQLENFNVTVTGPGGTPVEQNLYTSGGVFNATDFDPFTVPDLDVPNDGSPSEISAKTVGAGADNIDPSNLLFSNASGPNPISSASVKNGQAAYAGALFEFTDPLIPNNDLSDVLFLTSNHSHAGFVWGETSSAGGFGAAGDIAGSKVIPLPASFLMMLPALAGLGYLGRRRRATA